MEAKMDAQSAAIADIIKQKMGDDVRSDEEKTKLFMERWTENMRAQGKLIE